MRDCYRQMRSIIAILILLSVMGILFTPSLEDDVEATPPLSVALISSRLCVKSILKSLERSSVIYPASQPETARILPTTMRC
jgi:hypothetical protein